MIVVDHEQKQDLANTLQLDQISVLGSYLWLRHRQGEREIVYDEARKIPQYR